MPTQRLVLLHGVGLDHTMWNAMQTLLRRDTATFAPDLPGHGAGAAVRDDVDLEALADPIVAQLRPGDHLVGFSLGALVAQHIAARRPELVSTLVCVSAVCRRTDAERAAVLQRLAVAEADFTVSAEAALRRWFDGTDVSPQTVQRTRAVLLANDPRSYLRSYRVFATADADVAPELAQIAAPTLAITGELDPGSTPEMTERLAASIPDCRSEIIPGVRHMLPVQRPVALATTISHFIQERSLV